MNITKVIKARYSCREYKQNLLQAHHRMLLSQWLTTLTNGPFGTPIRLMLLASTPDDQQALEGLAAYGSVKNPQGFIVGAIENTPTSLEEYGYVVEHAVLKATELGLGTCWIGGIFTRSRFAQKIKLRENEVLPAIVSVGYETDYARDNFIRRAARGYARVPFEHLFFDGTFETPLSPDKAGIYAQPLEMVRLAPSASNKQPWRVVHHSQFWHFYLQRTKGYGKGSLLFTMLRLPDLQRVDLGIALCHFELTARELHIHGAWKHVDPQIATPENTEYIVSWQEF
ncbi:MAG: nitroreductase family protein [Bacteroidetes bacterium]|nr:nitroreductase family protein [Bacteroidota bacterium]